MNAKRWLLSGAVCISASILLCVVLGMYWLGKVRSYAHDGGRGGAADPFDGFGIVLVGGALANLVFFGGIVILVIGFIRLAKEPGGTARGGPAPRGGSGAG